MRKYQSRSRQKLSSLRGRGAQCLIWVCSVSANTMYATDMYKNPKQKTSRLVSPLQMVKGLVKYIGRAGRNSVENAGDRISGPEEKRTMKSHSSTGSIQEYLIARPMSDLLGTSFSQEQVEQNDEHKKHEERSCSSSSSSSGGGAGAGGAV